MIRESRENILNKSEETDLFTKQQLLKNKKTLAVASAIRRIVKVKSHRLNRRQGLYLSGGGEATGDL